MNVCFTPYVSDWDKMQVEQNHSSVPKYGWRESLTPGGKQVAVGSRTEPVPVCFHCNMKGHKVPRVVFCYLCCSKGYKSPDCSEKKTKGKSCKRIVVKHSPDCQNAIHGTVTGKEAIVFIDTGAESTLVSSNLVSEGNYTGDSIYLEFANATIRVQAAG